MDFLNTSGIRSPFSPRVKQSVTGRKISSAKKNQSFSKSALNHGGPTGEVLYKSQQMVIETYGLPLPVMVTEALAFASGEVTARLSECGWCWLVTGRRVLAWPQEENSSSPSAARELTLPQTDLAHKADLVVLFYEEDAQMPSCIGVSPEGLIRYWPSVGQEGVYVDVSAELAGQECDKLLEPAEIGLVLATTTCTLVLLKQQIVDGRATVSCRTLRPPSGLLGGIGRRVSLLFFGSMPAQGDIKLSGVVVYRDGPILEGGETSRAGGVAVLGGAGAGGPTLMLWGAALHQHALHTLLPPGGELSNSELTALDMAVSPSGSLYVLLSATGRDTKYAIVTINVEDPAAPRVTWQAPAGGGRWGEGGVTLVPLSGRLLLASRRLLALANTREAVGGVVGGALEAVEVAALGGAGLLAARGGGGGGGARLLTAHALLTLTLAGDHAHRSELMSGAPSSPDIYAGNLSILEMDPHEISTLTTDAVGKLKTAFLFHLRGDTASSSAIVQELFPAPPGGLSGGAAGRGERDVDAVLDRTVMKIATEMLDDVPAGDPRWKAATASRSWSIPLGSSAALQLGVQVADKQRALSLLLAFLHAAHLWPRLQRVSRQRGGGSTETAAALGALAERLAAAAALLALPAPPAPPPQLQQVAADMAEEEGGQILEAFTSGVLSAADIVYRRVSRITKLLTEIARGPPLVAAEILIPVLRETSRCRASWGGGGEGRGAGPGAGTGGATPPPLLRDPAALLQRLASASKDPNLDHATRNQILTSLATLADLVLADLAAGDSRNTRQAILPLVETGQIERAVLLAEKYRDFELMVRLCVDHEDTDRLAAYINKYENEGVPELVYSRLHEARRIPALLRLPPSPRVYLWSAAHPARRQARALLLARRPPAGCEVAAGAGGGGSAAAAAALLDEAREERTSNERMMMAASLAKLYLWSSDSTGDLESVPPSPSPSPPEARSGAGVGGAWREAGRLLALGSHTKALPTEIRTQFDIGEDCTPHSAEDLIQMYIESSGTTFTEFDYKKALDIAEFIPDAEHREYYKLRIWSRCVSRDSWLPAPVPAGGEAAELEPRARLGALTTFRLADLMQLCGADIESILPPLEQLLLEPEVADIMSSPAASFLLKFGYEWFTGQSQTMET